LQVDPHAQDIAGLLVATLVAIEFELRPLAAEFI
jgi:hypothetical protein